MHIWRLAARVEERPAKRRKCLPREHRRYAVPASGKPENLEK
jgi:hypothetical protein